jgi:hypothetical protein
MERVRVFRGCKSSKDSDSIHGRFLTDRNYRLVPGKNTIFTLLKFRIEADEMIACLQRGADNADNEKNAKTTLLVRCFRFLGFGRISFAEDLELSKIAA